jgi:hypothetical protein
VSGVVDVLVVVMVVAVIGFVAWQNRQKAARARSRLAAGDAALPGLQEYAQGQGWNGPTTEPDFDEATAGHVRSTLHHLHHIGDNTQAQIMGPRYSNVYTGATDGRPFVIANAWLGLDGRSLPGSACVLRMGQALPPLLVSPPRTAPSFYPFMKDVTLRASGSTGSSGSSQRTPNTPPPWSPSGPWRWCSSATTGRSSWSWTV